MVLPLVKVYGVALAKQGRQHIHVPSKPAHRNRRRGIGVDLELVVLGAVSAAFPLAGRSHWETQTFRRLTCVDTSKQSGPNNTTNGRTTLVGSDQAPAGA